MLSVFLVLGAVLAIAVIASPALAGRKGAKVAKKPAGCKAVVAYVVEGSVASVGEGSIAVDVIEANKHAQPFGPSVTMTVNAATKVARDDERVALPDVRTGEAATLQGRARKAADPATTTLVARMVSASRRRSSKSRRRNRRVIRSTTKGLSPAPSSFLVPTPRAPACLVCANAPRPD